MRPTIERATRRRPSTAVLVMIAVALIIAPTTIGCGGDDVDIEPKPPEATVKWGKPDGAKPTGVVIMLHGGGWQPNQNAYQAEMPLAQTLQGRGFATVVVGYGEGATGFRQIERVYSQARKRYPGLPICAHGISAGGTLALMLAAREPDLTCVATLVSPTDLSALEDQGADEAYDLAVKAFGEDELDDFSPARFADQIKANVLIVLAETDPIVPVEQGREFARARPQTELEVIPAGSTPVGFLHGAEVTPEAAEAAVERTFDFTDQALNGA